MTHGTRQPWRVNRSVGWPWDPSALPPSPPPSPPTPPSSPPPPPSPPPLPSSPLSPSHSPNLLSPRLLKRVSSAFCGTSELDSASTATSSSSSSPESPSPDDTHRPLKRQRTLSSPSQSATATRITCKVTKPSRKRRGPLRPVPTPLSAAAAASNLSDLDDGKISNAFWNNSFTEVVFVASIETPPSVIPPSPTPSFSIPHDEYPSSPPMSVFEEFVNSIRLEAAQLPAISDVLPSLCVCGCGMIFRNTTNTNAYAFPQDGRSYHPAVQHQLTGQRTGIVYDNHTPSYPPMPGSEELAGAFPMASPSFITAFFTGNYVFNTPIDDRSYHQATVRYPSPVQNEQVDSDRSSQEWIAPHTPPNTPAWADTADDQHPYENVLFNSGWNFNQY
ncbi:hypothetical protein M422DRAFT_53938 [Sphaerobolus stellatus SS14]|uniref:Unplaced genomic scaffold SPHSTscaffold_196, whole genome shotgun sequence n=1 Tax=Sphaerobolus stellatus (strain SS14) TaxID=990650 RepID=A0A0C9UX93_SPHS4|nr:hypothetical protein M422DRAFT_53938 [Sphaerobolus stellatus SS14]